MVFLNLTRDKERFRFPNANPVGYCVSSCAVSEHGHTIVSFVVVSQGTISVNICGRMIMCPALWEALGIE